MLYLGNFDDAIVLASRVQAGLLVRAGELRFARVLCVNDAWTWELQALVRARMVLWSLFFCMNQFLGHNSQEYTTSVAVPRDP